MNLCPLWLMSMVTLPKRSISCMDWTLRVSSKCFLYQLSLPVADVHARRKLTSMPVSATSPLPPTSVVEKRTFFRRCLAKFRQLQARYQPEVAPLLAQLSTNIPVASLDTESIRDIPLLLPSSLPPDTRCKCSKRLISMEKELRIGQCRDSLSQLQTNLTAQARLLKHKYVNVRHQGPNTRSHDLLNRVKKKIDASAAKYNHAREMLQVLDSSDRPEWRSEFLELRPQDIRCMAQAELPDAPTQERAKERQTRTLLNGNVIPEGNRTVSWIWRGSLKDDSGGHAGQKEYGEGLLLNSGNADIFSDTE